MQELAANALLRTQLQLAVGQRYHSCLALHAGLRAQLLHLTEIAAAAGSEPEAGLAACLQTAAAASGGGKALEIGASGFVPASTATAVQQAATRVAAEEHRQLLENACMVSAGTGVTSVPPKWCLAECFVAFASVKWQCWLAHADHLCW